LAVVSLIKRRDKNILHAKEKGKNILIKDTKPFEKKKYHALKRRLLKKSTYFFKRRLVSFLWLKTKARIYAKEGIKASHTSLFPSKPKFEYVKPRRDTCSAQPC